MVDCCVFYDVERLLPISRCQHRPAALAETGGAGAPLKTIIFDDENLLGLGSFFIWYISPAWRA